MTTEIRDIAIRLREVTSVYGFGSAFRSNHYNDIDLLAVFESSKPKAFDEYMTFLKITEKLSQRLGIKIDVTALTAFEAAASPLHESNNLIPLYERVDSF